MTRYLPSLSLATGIAGFLVLTLSTDSALADKRVALVVGNSAYHTVARLPNPERDAAAMAKLFRDAGFDTIVAENNVGNLDFKRAIRNFEDATIDSDIAVVYYAGHGIEIGGVNYLIPVDAKLASDRDAQDEAILLERLAELVDEAKRLRLIILDACRDNPFVNTMKRGRRTAMRAISSGLGKVEPAGTDTLIAYAAKAGSTAEDGNGEHSPFTTALLANLTSPGLDIRLAFGRIRDQVKKITDGRQEPFVYGSLGGGNISLVPAPEKPKEPDIAKVKTDYELVVQIGTKKAWDVFLGTYKTGFYADLARAQLAKLGESDIPTASAAPPKAVASLEPPAPPEPAKPTSDELRAWSKLRDTSDKDALANFISRYPNSPLALNAKSRLDVLERAAREREEKARAEREASQRRAEEERRAKEAARITELKAENERRAKELAEAEKQKKEEAARIAAQRRAEEEARAKEAARIAELKAENERRAKELAEAEKQKKEEAARIAAQRRAEEEARAKEATRIAELKAENERRAKELAEAEKQKVDLACRNEQAQLDNLNSAGNSMWVRDDLKRLSQDLTCERLRPQVVASLDKLTSELDKSAAPPEPAKPTSDELRAWSKLRDTKDAFANFISRYPNSPLALNAKNRLDVLERAAREREEKARAEREASQRRAEEERRAKEAARIAELKAENERRAKELAEAEKQKKEEAARIAELKAENERRAKELAEAEKQKKEEAARIAAQQRAEEEARAKEAARIAELKAENERRAKELAEAEKQKVDLACRNEQTRLDDLNSAGKSTSVRDDLKRLSQDLTCERLRPQVVASLDKLTSELDKSAAPPSPPANTPQLIASAQKELARLGCYSGDTGGKLDAATKDAIKKYQAQTEQPVTGIAVTDSFVLELGKRKLRVCPATVVVKQKRDNDRKEAKHESRKEAKSERSNSPRPQASQQASGGAHPMVGVGF